MDSGIHPLYLFLMKFDQKFEELESNIIKRLDEILTNKFEEHKIYLENVENRLTRNIEDLIAVLETKLITK